MKTNYTPKLPIAFIDMITNNKIVVICPLCGCSHTYTRNHVDEGTYVQQCPNKKYPDQTRFKYVVDKDELFGDGTNAH